MSVYSIHFIIGLLFSFFVALVILSLSKKKRRKAFAVLIIYFVLFYNYDYSLLPGITPFFICYAGALYSCLLVLFLASAKKCALHENAPKYAFPKIVFLTFIQFILIFIYLCFPWAIDTFPLSNADAVLFTVFAGENEGAEEFVISSFLKRVPVYAVGTFLVILVGQLALAYNLSKGKISIKFTLWKVDYTIVAGDFKSTMLRITKPVTLAVFVCFAIQSVLLPGIFVSEAFAALTQEPVDSEFYKSHYVQPDSLKIKPPEHPKNLIVIFLESMETNFAKYTPEVVLLERENMNFPPGGVSVAGTSWTIAGITSKMCGIPLNMPMGVEEYHGRLPTYLPNARCLMDILADESYNQIFSQGTSGDFTQKKKFWNLHGNVVVHDMEYYKNAGMIPKEYFEFWGIEDRKLYGFVKEELDTLSKSDKPFALYMLTVDTHQPDGFVDNRCEMELEKSLEPLPKSLRCASKQLYDFIEWTKKQPWYENTVISVMGDHTMPMLSVKANVPLEDSLYWTNFILNSAIKDPVKPRQYSSLDMFPTLLESMGFIITDRRLGLGSSLYSDSLTMLELYGRRALDSLLRERSIQYDYFLFGN